MTPPHTPSVLLGKVGAFLGVLEGYWGLLGFLGFRGSPIARFSIHPVKLSANKPRVSANEEHKIQVQSWLKEIRLLLM